MLIWKMAVVGFLVVLNGFFAMSELAVVSARKVRLQRMARDGRPGAKTALELAEDPTAFLSTVQIGISLIGIVAGAYSGATFAGPLADAMTGWGFPAGYAYTIAFTLVVIATTYLSLVIGELVPKRLALNNAEGIACLVAKPMKALSLVGTPVVWFLSFSTETVLKLLRARPKDDDGVTEDDVRAMIAEGTKTGVFEHAEREMIDGVLKLADRDVRSIMVPKHDTVSLAIDDSVDAMIGKVRESGHSRYPVSGESGDDIVGVLHVKTLVQGDEAPDRDEIKSAIQKPLYIAESMRILTLLEQFQDSTVHMAIVVDEYGAFEGVVTPTDILIAIAGDLPEHEHGDLPSVTERADGSLLIDGATRLDALGTILDGVLLENQGDFVTLAGFMMKQFGHVPDVGAVTQAQGWRFEIMDLDGRRIDKVMASRIEDQQSESVMPETSSGS